MNYAKVVAEVALWWGNLMDDFDVTIVMVLVIVMVVVISACVMIV